MIVKCNWDERLNALRDNIKTLYFNGKMCLNELNSFMRLLDDMDSIMERLFFSVGLFTQDVKKDIIKMTGELTLLEYNVSLIANKKRFIQCA